MTQGRINTRIGKYLSLHPPGRPFALLVRGSGAARARWGGGGRAWASRTEVVLALYPALAFASIEREENTLGRAVSRLEREDEPR